MFPFIPISIPNYIMDLDDIEFWSGRLAASGA